MSIFSDEWRRCLREQYKYVVRNNDNLTKTSLTDVMNQVGFGEAELKQLEIEATMRVEDNPPDFKPNLEMMNPNQAQVQASGFQPHPAECQCPSCVNIDLTPHDEEGQPIPIEEEDPDAPSQMSMF